MVSISVEQTDVCVVGSVNLDLVATTARLPLPGETILGHDFSEQAGGKGLNQAIAARRCGASVRLCAAVGDDHAGDRLCSVMRTDELETELVVVAGRPTGRALIAVSDEGENSIVVVPGANASLEPAHVLRAAGAARIVLAQLEVPVETVAAAFTAARAAGARTVLNPAPALALTVDLLSLCDVVIANEHEAEQLGGPQRLFELGATAVIVTLGARGARLYDRDGSTLTVPSFPVNAVDSTAAGDAFAGAIAAALAREQRLNEAIRFACAAGALAATRLGAVASLPLRAEVDALLNSP